MNHRSSPLIVLRKKAPLLSSSNVGVDYENENRKNRTASFDETMRAGLFLSMMKETERLRNVHQAFKEEEKRARNRAAAFFGRGH